MQLLIPFLPWLLFQAAPPPPADTFPIEPDLPCAVASDQPESGYQVRLTPEQERRAMSVYRRAIVITAHDHCFRPEDFEQMAQGGVTVRTIKPIVDGHYRQGGKRYPIEAPVDGWVVRGRRALEILQRRSDQSEGRIVVIRKADDIFRVKRENKLGMIFSFEGARALGGDVENLEMYQRMGLRELQLYWAVPSPLKNADGTLSPFGLDVIREANRLGVVVDLSHMGAKAFEVARAAASQPFIISHCGAAMAPKSQRGGTDRLDDETIRAVAKAGGVICMHFNEAYIQGRHGPHATVEDLVDHMEYIKRLVGADSIGLGTDFFPERGWRWVEGAEKLRLMPNVAREMVRRGFTDEEIEKILGLNLIRVYRQVWKN